MRQTQLRIDQTKAHALAQAGVMRAIWDWYVSDTAAETNRRWSPLDTTVTGNLIFKAGSDSAAARLHSNFSHYVFKKDSTSGTGSGTISHVQSVGTSSDKTASSTTLGVSVPGGGVAAGNFLIVTFAMDDNAGTVSCADTQSNVYTKRADVTNSGHVRTVIFAAPVTTALVSGNTITVTHPSSTAEALSVSEFAGVASLDVTASATGSGTGPSSGNATTTMGDELLIGAIGVEGPSGDSFAAGGSYNTGPPTRAGTSGDADATNITINPEYRIVSAAGAYAADGTITSRDWAAATATFYGSAGWSTSGGNRRLQQWQLRNIHNGSSLTLDQIKVSWTPTNAAVLNDLVLNGVSKWPGGTAASGATTDVTDTVLANNGYWGDTTTYLQWDASPPDPVTVTCQFIFSGDTASSDAKSHEVVMWSGAQSGAGLPGPRTFDITSTGQVNQTTVGAFKVLKTVKATVSTAPGLAAVEIMDWDEGDKNIP